MSFTPFNKFIFRTPLLPFSKSTESVNGDAQLIGDSFLDILFISSIDLCTSVTRLGRNENLPPKIKNSILKYKTRACTRCTPFGLLAGIGIGKILNENISTIQLEKQSKFRRQTRLDMDYLDNIVKQINNKIEFREYLTYDTNKTLYKIIDKYRFVETKVFDKKRTHLTSSIEETNYLKKIFNKAKNGATIIELAATITDDDITPGEKIEFIHELIDEQILISNFQISLTGTEAHQNILHILKNIKPRIEHRSLIENYVHFIEDIYDRIKRIDENGINNSNLKDYEQVVAKIEQADIPFNKKFLFQTDLIIKTERSQISTSITDDVLKLIDVISRLTPRNGETNMTKFIERFYEKWENNAVPLALALDPEYGISYPIATNDNFNINDLVDDFILPTKGGQLSSHEYDPILTNFWYDKYFHAIKNNLSEIILTEKDIENFPSRMHELPNTISAMLNVLAISPTNGKANKIYVKSVGGSSSANLLARFCHADKDIHAYCEEIIKKEIELNSDKIIAEITHLPEARLGNILSRPKMYDYEICYLAKPSVASEFQIYLEDLTIRIVENKILLFSVKHNKQVIPKLTNAHNYKYRNLPVYQFLCDLQFNENLSHLGINLGHIGAYCNYLPRISFERNLIIQAAKWQFSKVDFIEISKGTEIEMIDKFYAFKKKWKMPTYIALTEGDNELFINTKLPSSVLMFISEIKRKDRITIFEVLWTSDNKLIKGKSGIHVNEILLGFHKSPLEISDKPSFFERAAPPKNYDSFLVQRHYPNGKWLCLKFYIGHKNAERLLIELEVLNKQLVLEGTVEKWFFIRFNDPNFHLRIRYLAQSSNYHSQILEKITFIIEKFLFSDALWRYQIDTYTPELERYGKETIEVAETIFFEDSKTILKLLNIINEDNTIKRWLVGMQNIDMYLNLFKYNLENKIKFTENLKDYFSLEFNNNKSLKIQIDKKFSENRKIIDSWFYPKNEQSNIIATVLISRSQHLEEPVSKLINHYSSAVINKWLTSYTHMSTNRLINSKSRLHEFIIYELLNRTYISQSWKLKSNKE